MFGTYVGNREIKTMSLSTGTRIRMALMAAGYTQAQVARACSVEATTVSAVVHGRCRSKRIEERIALLTGLSLAELWPQWHGPDASKRRRRPRMSPTQIADALRALAS